MARRTKPVRVGVIGAGRGAMFAQSYHVSPDSETVALCDRDAPRLRVAAKQLKIPGLKLYTDLDKFLKHAMDAVIVTSDGPLHAEHTCLALEAGFHVQSEVPMDYTQEGCTRIIETVERTGLKYMFAENYQYIPHMATLKRWIKRGKFGQVVYAEAEYVHDVRNMDYRDDEGNYYTWEEARKHPKAKRAWRSGVHPISYITHSLGPLLHILDDRVTQVSCLSTGCHTAPHDGNPDAEVAIFKCRSGAVIKILCAHSIASPGHNWCTLLGTKGSVVMPRGTATLPAVYFEGESKPHTWEPIPWDKINAKLPPEAKKWGHGGSDYFLAGGFLRAILEDRPIPIDHYRGADYTIPGIVACRSAENGGLLMPVPDLRPDVRNNFRVRKANVQVGL